jgi:hypothetical protein
MFDSKVAEPGPAPLILEEGILLFYNGADDKLVYRLGWALFDMYDPTRLLARADTPIFEPELEWEMTGQVRGGSGSGALSLQEPHIPPYGRHEMADSERRKQRSETS